MSESKKTDKELIEMLYKTLTDAGAVTINLNEGMPNGDATEAIRREQVAEINALPGSREALEQQHGQVWDTEQLRADFEVTGFMAPFCVVKRKDTGEVGSLTFQHSPRFYFSYAKD